MADIADAAQKPVTPPEPPGGDITSAILDGENSVPPPVPPPPQNPPTFTKQTHKRKGPIIAVIFLLLITIPLGVYYIRQQQELRKQAVAPARPNLCQSLEVSTATLTPGQSVTISSTSKNEANNFSYAFYNLDNLYNPGNPKSICVASGGDVTTVPGGCPTGTHHLLFKDPDSSARTTGSRTISYENIFVKDENNSNAVPSRVQINGYFQTTDGLVSLPNGACVKWITAASESPVPNCNITTAPTTITVGQTGTFTGEFTSPQGALAGQIFRSNNFTPLTCTGCRTTAPGVKDFPSATTGTHSWTWTPTAADIGTHTIYCRAWNDAIAECRPSNLVDGPPRFACTGPNHTKTVTVVAEASPTNTPTSIPTSTPTNVPDNTPTKTPTPTQPPIGGPVDSPTPTPIPVPEVPVAGIGPGVLGISIVTIGSLLVLLGLAL